MVHPAPAPLSWWQVRVLGATKTTLAAGVLILLLLLLAAVVGTPTVASAATTASAAAPTTSGSCRHLGHRRIWDGWLRFIQ